MWSNVESKYYNQIVYIWFGPVIVPMLAMPTISSIRRNDCSQLINHNGWPKLQDLNGLSLYSGGGDWEGINNVLWMC